MPYIRNWVDARWHSVVHSAAPSGEASGGSIAFKGLWNSSTDPSVLFSPEAFASFDVGSTPSTETQANRTFKTGQVDRMATARHCPGLVQGCHSNKKNVCRSHLLSTEECILLDRLLYPIYKWVDTIEKDVLEKRMGFLC